jgi:hypothetical protein
VPGAGRRPRVRALEAAESRTRRRSARVAVLLVGALLVEATLYAANAAEAAGGGRFQERYLMTILPLVAPAFCLWVTRGAPARWFVAVSALALLLVSARIPLSAYTSDTGRQDSPFLLALYWLEKKIGYDNGSLALAAVGRASSRCLLPASRSRPAPRGPARARRRDPARRHRIAAAFAFDADKRAEGARELPAGRRALGRPLPTSGR